MNISDALGHTAIVQSLVVDSVMGPMSQVNEMLGEHYDIVTTLGSTKEQAKAVKAVAASGEVMELAQRLAFALGDLAKEISVISKGEDG